MEVIPTALHKFVKVTVFFKKNKNKFRTKVYNKMIRPFNLEKTDFLILKSVFIYSSAFLCLYK